MDPAARRKADKNLSSCMKVASKGAGIIIKLGRELVEDEESLDDILGGLKEALPCDILGGLKEALPCGTRQTSYGLLLHCTFKVSNSPA